MQPTKLFDGTNWVDFTAPAAPVVVSASLSANAIVAANGVIIYDLVQFDTANAYNPATGLFTAPSPGYYEISQNAYIGGADDAQYVQVNGVDRYAYVGLATNIPLDFGSGSIIILLAANDTVSVNSDTGSTYLGSTSPTFTIPGSYLNIKKL